MDRTIHILAVIGSARKGNTYRTVKEIEKEFNSYKTVHVEYLFLKETNLQGCLGCTTCLVRGEEKCPLKDDREAIEQKMMKADGLIFASPNYVCNISSLMKNFIDRFAYCGHRPRFFEKPALLVCTSAGPGGVKSCMNSLAGIATGGFHIIEKIQVMTPLFQLTNSVAVKNQKEIKKKTKKFYKAVTEPHMKTPSISDLMKFQAVRTFLICRNDYLPSDYAYWKEKGWLGKVDYYYDAPMGPFKKLLGRLTGRLCIVYYKKVLLKGVKK